MLSELDYETLTAMEKFGGSFVQSLGACMRRADHINFKILKDAFPHYWEVYQGILEDARNGQ